MCLLTFLPPGMPPDLDALHIGAENNPDGHGYAIVVNDRIVAGRDLRPEPIIEAFATARRQHPSGPALFHSRLGTAGDRSVNNCHPLPVGGDERTVLAHNGILPTAVQPGKGDPRSDTRILCEQYLPGFGSLRHRRTRLRLERWLTRHNKIVVLTVDRRFRQAAYILNEASGIWHGGIWYSNDGYLPAPPPRWSGQRHPGWDWPPEDWPQWNTERCGYCMAVLDPTATECPDCGWCIDCCQLPRDCLCYPPAVLGRHIGTSDHHI